ncbi:response regulator transcription factor [Actinoplanes aureus]|uniref:Response regulator transcription factor n=1 Tax=Actinoplanes aureus TaxID=2792083 RepID=A0A931CP28_9ACTN|nr:response regulator transcription factor [Actinoplanes aureus]MBG0568450.1 response regulator transcription factor [Actinoplanes aureus]
MFVRIAVADPLPVFRRGVMAILRDAGFETEAPDDLVAWVRGHQATAALVTVCSESDWQLLETLHRASADVVLVALLEQVTVADSVRALRAGASCVVPRDTSPSALQEAFGAAVRGQSLVSIEVLRALTVPSGTAPAPAPASNQPSPDERKWLRELARGTTVGRLASDVGYSERMMFRLLRDLYTRLGADNRTDALIKAQAQGWL